MRDDALKRVEEPKWKTGHLAGGTPAKVIDVNTECLDRLAERVALILDLENEGEFNASLRQFEPCPEPVEVQEPVDLLGIYDSGTKTIVIDKNKIRKCVGQWSAEQVNISYEDLKKVVEIHEDAHALHHLAGDPKNNNEIWDGFGDTPSYLLEILAQLFAHDECQHDHRLAVAFEELEKRQPLTYRLWRLFRRVPRERFYWLVREDQSRVVRILLHLGFRVRPWHGLWMQGSRGRFGDATIQHNIFDFATSELSHSAFFAWLIKQIAPDARGYNKEVRDTALKVVNEMLRINGLSPISSLADIESCDVKPEEKGEKVRIDITVYIRSRYGRNIGIIIENKIGAHESRKDQLKDYHETGINLIDEHFKHVDPLCAEKAFVYMKTDYDFEDPLVRRDDSDNCVPTNFKKMNWKAIYGLFGTTRFEDPILRSYSEWIERQHASIATKLNVSCWLSSPDAEDILGQDHIGQVALLKCVFPQLLKGQPSCAGKDKDNYLRFCYGDNLYISLGSDKGRPWTQLWGGWQMAGAEFFYRLQQRTRQGKPCSLLEAKLCGDNPSQKNTILNIYDPLVRDLFPKGITDANTCFIPTDWETTMGAFVLVGSDIATLKHIEILHERFVGQAIPQVKPSSSTP